MAGFLSELFVERFWLRRAERRAKEYGPARTQRIRVFARAARSRTQAASTLRNPVDAGAAFALSREAFQLSMTAWLAARGEHETDDVLTPSEAWQRLDAIATETPERGRLGALLSGDVLAADRLSSADALAARREIEALLRYVSDQYETRGVLRIKIVRILRVLGTLFGVLALFVLTLAWALAPPSPPVPNIPPRGRLHPR